MSWNRPTKPPREQRIAERAARNAAQAQTCIPRRAAVMGGGTAGPAPKSVPWRCQTLLEMARGRPCLLCPPGACTCTPGSAVACHSNLGIHGKAKGRKADDCFTVAGGDKAHRWLDQPIGHDGPTRAEKEARFMAAHARQVLAWRQIATDPTEPTRFRRAALAALERLGATAFGAAT